MRVLSNRIELNPSCYSWSINEVFMEITLLGTGNPQPNLNRSGPSNHLAIGGQSVLVDCGSGSVHQMVKAGLEPRDIDMIVLTHMHSDHTIDLAHVLITGWIRYRDKPVRVIGPPQDLWFWSLTAALAPT